MPVKGKVTLLEGERRFKQVDWGSAELPPCQAPMMGHGVLQCKKPGEFDTPTKAGPWADLCEDHVISLTYEHIMIGFHRIRHKP